MIVNNILKWLFPLYFIFIGLIFSATLVADDKFKKIGGLFSEKRYQEAIEKMQPLLSTATQSEKVELFNGIGWSYLKLNEYPKAEENFLESHKLAQESNNIKMEKTSSNNLGIVKYLQDNITEARDYFLKNKDSKTAKSYLKLIEEKEKKLKYQKILDNGIEKSREGDYVGAIEQYDKYLAVELKSYKALEYKGYALLKSGKVEQSIKTLNSAKSIEPNHKFTYLNLLKAYCTLDKDNEVENLIKEAPQKSVPIIEWYKYDAEFKEMCSKNPYILKIVRE